MNFPRLFAPGRVRRTGGIGVLGFAILWLAGCNSGVSYYGVYGTMTLNGKPVDYAEMHVRPLTEVANRGRTVFVYVINGKYDTREIGGVPVGPAEWTIRVAEQGSIKIKNPEHVATEERDHFLTVKQQVFTKQIEIVGEEINIELP